MTPPWLEVNRRREERKQGHREGFVVGVFVGILIGFILTALLLAQDAKAGYRMDKIRDIANTKWNSPCGGTWRFNVDLNIAPPIGSKETVNGWADTPNCTITVQPPVVFIDDYALWCTLVVHEVGHLAGKKHRHNPNSVMYPVLPSPTNYRFKLCDKAFPREEE